MKRIFLIICLSLLCSSCGIAEDFNDMREKQQLLTQKIKNQYGWDANIGWSLDNDIITLVTISISTDEVDEGKISEIKASMESLVIQSFKQKPKSIIIQFEKTTE